MTVYNKLFATVDSRNSSCEAKTFQNLSVDEMTTKMSKVDPSPLYKKEVGSLNQILLNVFNT